ncbi:hypothetical protein ADIARSV_1980 [Arcticibacter svalbardensis MN12-7]|uniref:Uncharacterized protein n=1 Tax=Arcticibacter svalbardensis MN12-7 TaxID=1150600 RepID=R9GTJ3_9SPHI|nr:hypothetical protein [Arcticibacter svalbardensis]EOR94875.1 hypothetical protein ADIARSV_1980 [Arcticibacter svalbardensis MN12-7]
MIEENRGLEGIKKNEASDGRKLKLTNYKPKLLKGAVREGIEPPRSG